MTAFLLMLSPNAVTDVREVAGILSAAGILPVAGVHDSDIHNLLKLSSILLFMTFLMML
jgi:hypothetical protein